MALGVLEHRVPLVEHFAQVLQRLLAPGRDLGGVDAVAGSQFGQRGLAPERFQGNPGLELRGVVPPGAVSSSLLLCIGIIAVTLEQFPT